MEININCDLGEKSKFHSTKHDPDLLKIVNSANIACGFHAGDEETMKNTIEISKKNNVSIGAHPSFNDPQNFGRKRHNLPESEIKKLIVFSSIVLFLIFTSGFGIFFVIGYILFPKPAPRIIAFLIFI